MKQQRKIWTEEEREALTARFGAVVALDMQTIDQDVPVFHRLGIANVTNTIPFPVMHATAFAVPCTDCWPVERNGK